MRWAGLGLELTGLILAGIFLGAGLERFFGFPGWFQAGAVFLAFLIWLVLLSKALKEIPGNQRGKDEKT